jgi:hypothetical protein
LDGIAALTRIQYLYLDDNLLPEKEIMRLLRDLPGAAHRLEVKYLKSETMTMFHFSCAVCV